GSAVELGCWAEGRPPPLLSWFRGAAVLREEPLATALRLLLPRLQPQEAGNYRCVAENRHGRHNQSLQLHVACEGGSPAPLGSPSALWGPLEPL
ncbi:SMP protein, partial [Geococcyx californianus]|nr:SMP protein [Geococcyx californianus]